MCVDQGLSQILTVLFISFQIPNNFSRGTRRLWNYWKLDHSKITEETVHRNFGGLLEWFPELTSVKREMLTPPPPDYYTALEALESAPSKAENHRHEGKFCSSFSIDSILKKNYSPSGLCCKEEPGMSIKVEQEPSWCTERTVGLKMKFTWDSHVDTHHGTGDGYSIRTAGGSSDHGLSPRPTKRMCRSPLSQQEKFNKCKTYMAMIAFVLQDAPGNMLTFSQVRKHSFTDHFSYFKYI